MIKEAKRVCSRLDTRLTRGRLEGHVPASLHVISNNYLQGQADSPGPNRPAPESLLSVTLPVQSSFRKEKLRLNLWHLMSN